MTRPPLQRRDWWVEVVTGTSGNGPFESVGPVDLKRRGPSHETERVGEPEEKDTKTSEDRSDR